MITGCFVWQGILPRAFPKLRVITSVGWVLKKMVENRVRFKSSFKLNIFQCIGQGHTRCWAGIKNGWKLGRVSSKVFPSKLVTIFFNYILYFEGFCALCFMVGFCSYSYACECFSLFLCSYSLALFMVLPCFSNLYCLPPFLWLCTSVGELEGFSSFNSNFSIIPFQVSFSFKMFLCL